MQRLCTCHLSKYLSPHRVEGRTTYEKLDSRSTCVYEKMDSII